MTGVDTAQHKTNLPVGLYESLKEMQTIEGGVSLNALIVRAVKLLVTAWKEKRDTGRNICLIDKDGNIERLIVV